MHACTICGGIQGKDGEVVAVLETEPQVRDKAK